MSEQAATHQRLRKLQMTKYLDMNLFCYREEKMVETNQQVRFSFTGDKIRCLPDMHRLKLRRYFKIKNTASNTNKHIAQTALQIVSNRPTCLSGI